MFSELPDALQLSGAERHSALIFAEYSERIRQETGIDVYERKATLLAEMPIIRRLLDKFRKDKTFIDDGILDEIWRDCLREMNILPKEEQQAKDAFSLQKARTAKDDLRLAGLSDAARFGYCSKNRDCESKKEVRLLVRGFCPDCRGLKLQTNSEGKVSSTFNKDKVHPKTLQLTSEERQALVLNAKHNHPTASVRELARLTTMPSSTVSDILRNPILKNKLENSDEVQEFLRKRAEGNMDLTELVGERQ